MKFFLFLAAALISLNAIAQPKIGESSPEITLKDVTGKPVSLSSLKGKVVLIDFWASWCGPCRRVNPSVVKLYNKYRSKGFEVFGVSIDSEKSAWIKAIKNDKITYTQVLDNSDGPRPAVGIKYGVEVIPSTFLLDKTGTIVAIDLEGKELENKVAELLQ